MANIDFDIANVMEEDITQKKSSDLKFDSYF